MKKLAASFVLILMVVNAFAQSDSKLHFGLKAAPSLAWMRSDSKDFESDGSRFGFIYGLVTEFNFADHYAFATGIDITYRGGKSKSIITNVVRNTANTADSITSTSTFSTTYSIQYIELPLTLKLKTNEIGYLTYYLQAGVAPGINIRARLKYSSTTQTTIGGTTLTSSDEDSGINIKENINNLNFSMIIGGGIEYTISGSTVLLAGIQFNNGFLDVFDSDIKVNSNYLALTIAVLF